MTMRAMTARQRVTLHGICTGVAVLLNALSAGACAASEPAFAWEPRLHGDAVIMLGEVHDNAEHHRMRLAVLRRAFAAGWRPAIAMEQFDRERQQDIDLARRERPHDAQSLIERAAPASAGRSGGGWNWSDYRPFVDLALEYDVPLIAANLSAADATKIVRGGFAAAFDDASITRLGLDRPVPSELQAAQEREIDAGHCHALPPSQWPRMARAQIARDALMAEVLRNQLGAGGVVLLAGNGHVRRDIGVPRWLGSALQDRMLSVAFLEEGSAAASTEPFDAVVPTVRAERSDPCAGFGKQANTAPR